MYFIHIDEFDGVIYVSKASLICLVSEQNHIVWEEVPSLVFIWLLKFLETHTYFLNDCLILDPADVSYYESCIQRKHFSSHMWLFDLE